MISLRILIILAMFVMFETKQSTAIQCYECGHNNQKCNERPFNVSSKGVSKCVGLACFKLEIISFDQYISTQRGCWQSSVQHHHNCSTIIINNEGYTNCSCPWNLCNGGYEMRIGLGSILLITLLAYFAKSFDY